VHPPAEAYLHGALAYLLDLAMVSTVDMSGSAILDPDVIAIGYEFLQCRPADEFVSQPPTSGESVSLPSLKAPAPPQPQVMEQGRQPISQPTGCTPLAGHLRFSMSKPFSMRSTLQLFLRVNSRAAKIPAGPAPTIMAS